MFSCLFVSFFLCFETRSHCVTLVSLWSPGCPDFAVLARLATNSDHPVSDSKVLRLKACAIKPGYTFENDRTKIKQLEVMFTVSVPNKLAALKVQ